MEVQDLFLLGMKRSIPELLPIEGPGFNLGAGRAKLKDLENLDRPNWNAELYRIPADDSTQKAVVAFHFLEHLHDPIRMLRECQRVLQPGGVVHICVPHAMSMCAYQDLDRQGQVRSLRPRWEQDQHHPAPGHRRRQLLGGAARALRG